jgi:FkbM family methyltransferase
MTSFSVRRLLKAIAIAPLMALEAFASAYSRLLGVVHGELRFVWSDRQVALARDRMQFVEHRTRRGDQVQLKLATPNRICRYRAETFSTKEPETLEWIDRFGADGPLFDIGANVGLYSLYYASSQSGRCYAFEPSVFNLPLLVRNVALNSLEHKILVVPLALSQDTGFADFNMSGTEEGGALSSFGVEYGQDGEALVKAFSYRMLGTTLDEMLSSGLLPELPRLLKIDVDGIEHLILKGARRVLSAPSCVSVLVEVGQRFAEQADSVSAIMQSCGFVLEQRGAAEPAPGLVNDNQIWVKSVA